MAQCNSSRYFFKLTSLQIGDLQSYLSDLSLFLAPDCKTFYVLVDNRPWLEDLVSRPAHLWQLMVTKSRMSPFAIRRTQKGRKDTPTASENLRKWFTVIDAATLSRKRALLPVKKLRNSLFANSKLGRTLYGFIVFQVAWKDVRGNNYLNELQSDTSLAIEAKYMKRWEFDSIDQAAKGICSWFPGTIRERFLLQNQLHSMQGDVFHDALNCDSANNNENISNIIGDQNRMSMIDSPPADVSHNKKKLTKFLDMNIEDGFYATEYKDVLLLFRFNDHDLPFKLQNIITSDLRLLTLLEAGLPSWVIFFQSYPLFCHIYRPYMCPLARVLYVMISLVTVVIGFYDLYKNIPLLKATAARLCGPLFGWIETWEMVTRIKYLGTMLFLHNSRKAVKWLLMITQPLSEPFLEVFLPIRNVYIQIGEYFCSFIWILFASFWNLVENLIEIILFPVYFVSSIVWMIVTAILYPILWLIWGIIYAPIWLILGLTNFVGFIFSQTYDFIGATWQLVSGLFKLASTAETGVGSYEVSVSMWRALWNDLFSQIFRAVRSILNGFVAFFTACNRHRLSIYNHLQEFIRRIYQPTTQISHALSSIQRAKKSTMAEATELRTKNIKQS